MDTPWEGTPSVESLSYWLAPACINAQIDSARSLYAVPLVECTSRHEGMNSLLPFCNKFQLTHPSFLCCSLWTERGFTVQVYHLCFLPIEVCLQLEHSLSRLHGVKQSQMLGWSLLPNDLSWTFHASVRKRWAIVACDGMEWGNMITGLWWKVMSVCANTCKCRSMQMNTF